MTRTIVQRLIAVAVPGLLCAQAAGAAVLTYDEAADGDLPNAVYTPFVLDVGLNTVQGAVSVNVPSLGGNDFDRLRFTIVEGQQIDSIVFETLEVTNLVEGTTIVGSNGIDLRLITASGSLALVAEENTFFNALDPLGPFSLFQLTDVFPVGAGDYHLSPGLSYSSVGCTDDCGGTYGYRFSIDVSSVVVPLPAAAWLLLSGLAGLGILRRRGARRTPNGEFTR